MSANGKLDGRRAIVTGGSAGLGGAIVRAFAAEGADVAFCHLNDGANATTTEAAVTAAGRQVFAMECDVSDADRARRFVTGAETAIGPADILVNGAGHGAHCPFEDMPVEDFERMMAVHVRGTFVMTQAVYPGMVARRWGRIINISSMLAHRGAVGMVHYCAAKGAIAGFTRALAREGAPHGVLVNAIAPGPIETAMTAGFGEEWKVQRAAQIPDGRLGTPEDVAPSAVLLASEGGAFYAGTMLMPGGGDVMV